MLVKQDTQINNIQFRFLVSPFVISKSNLYSKKVLLFKGKVLNNLKTDIFVAKSLVLLYKSIIIIILVIIVSII